MKKRRTQASHPWLRWLDTLEDRFVAAIIGSVALVVFFTGLGGGFQGDDTFQIVDNLPVHSLQNLPYYFKSSTFFNGQHLVGSFYRPMMTTTFALIYELAEAAPVAYHLVQLLLIAGAAFVLHLFLKQFMRPALALGLALIFLVHPINSQAAFAIPSMQEPLFFLSGMLALLVLSRSSGWKGLVVAAGLLLFSLFSKETAVLFVLVALLYLLLFDKRRRLLQFAAMLVVPVALYLYLRINAVGLLGENTNAAPISQLDLAGRLLTMPSILQFYLTKFLFPAELATGYYWVHTSFGVREVLLPLLAWLALIALLVRLGVAVRAGLPTKQFKAYLFFAAWAGVGLVLHLHFVPLDMTACETWFYFSSAGVLGMLGVASALLRLKIDPRYVVGGFAVLIAILGVRTAIRGLDYQSQYTLGMHDIAVVPDHYFAMNNVAQALIGKKEYAAAQEYAQRSINLHPTATNYTNLGVALQMQNDYPGAKRAYEKALEYGSLNIIYENLGILAVSYGEPQENVAYLRRALKEYPQSYKLWIYLAIQESVNGNREEARKAITKAADHGPVPAQLHRAITKGEPYAMKLPHSGKQIIVQ
ncbi:tetratricopeptide repeat protein [Candidatus Saccharibacteria bacterium]|nr:tetratricopeptide repeat protein [Candidatus Saccharibacteria bacterium]